MTRAARRLALSWLLTCALPARAAPPPGADVVSIGATQRPLDVPDARPVAFGSCGGDWKAWVLPLASARALADATAGHSLRTSLDVPCALPLLPYVGVAPRGDDALGGWREGTLRVRGRKEQLEVGVSIEGCSAWATIGSGEALLVQSGQPELGSRTLVMPREDRAPSAQPWASGRMGVHLGEVRAADMLPFVRSMLSPAGTVAANQAGDAVLVEDEPSRVAAIARALGMLDGARLEERVHLRIVRASAPDPSWTPHGSCMGDSTSGPVALFALPERSRPGAAPPSRPGAAPRAPAPGSEVLLDRTFELADGAVMLVDLPASAERPAMDVQVGADGTQVGIGDAATWRRLDCALTDGAMQLPGAPGGLSDYVVVELTRVALPGGTDVLIVEDGSACDIVQRGVTRQGRTGDFLRPGSRLNVTAGHVLVARPRLRDVVRVEAGGARP